MRRPAYGGISLDLLRREPQGAFLFELRFRLCFQCVLQGEKSGGIVGFAHFIDVFHVPARQVLENGVEACLVDIVFDVDELRFAEHVSCHDVELASRRSPFGIDIVRLACRGERSPLMVEGGDEFGGDGIAHIAASQHGGIAGGLAFRVACLNHEMLDDAVEQGAVIRAFFHQLDKVVPVLRGFVV